MNGADKDETLAYLRIVLHFCGQQAARWLRITLAIGKRGIELKEGIDFVKRAPAIGAELDTVRTGRNGKPFDRVPLFDNNFRRALGMGAGGTNGQEPKTQEGTELLLRHVETPFDCVQRFSCFIPPGSTSRYELAGFGIANDAVPELELT